MRNKRAKPNQPESFQSRFANRGEHFTMIYDSLLDSEAWYALTKSQQVLLIACLREYKGKEIKKGSPCIINQDGTEETSPLFFTMNKGKWCKKYRLYSKGNGNGFERDRNELIEKGFISYIQSGKTTRSSSVYAFSDKWQYYKGEE